MYLQSTSLLLIFQQIKCVCPGVAAIRKQLTDRDTAFTPQELEKSFPAASR
jgi:hypothetical protein